MGINPHIFSAYIKGGKLWPQKRWAINVFILDAMASLLVANNFSGSTLEAFLNSQLSSKQLIAVTQVMKIEHQRYGIPLRKVDYSSVLKLEWLKAKLGVAQTIRAYLVNQPSTYCSEELAVDELVKILADRIVFLSTNYNPSKVKMIIKIMQKIKAVVDEHKNLASIFLYSFAYQFNKHTLLYQREEIETYLKNYQLTFFKNDAVCLRDESVLAPYNSTTHN